MTPEGRRRGSRIKEIDLFPATNMLIFTTKQMRQDEDGHTASNQNVQLNHRFGVFGVYYFRGPSLGISSQSTTLYPINRNK